MRESWDGDRDPLAALAMGDPQLFERFVEVESVTFTGFFRRLGADLQEAEDLTQDLFLKLYRQAPAYAASERLAPFAFRIARNAWIDRTRRHTTRQRSQHISGETGSDSSLPGVFDRTAGTEPEAAQFLATKEESASLYRALAGLSEMHRAVFELGALQELSYSEVGEILGVPVGTVKSRMFYALRHLRERLEPGDEHSSSASNRAEGPV
ncbi:MAG: RNA polymerase sigma-70 factor (ECF subfamily) [Planctomycetota bacterium]